MCQSTKVREQKSPSCVHRQAAFKLPSPFYLPPVEEPKEQRQDRRHNEHASDQPMRKATVDRERVPRRIAEEDVNVGHVRAKDQRCKTLAGLRFEAGLAKCPARERMSKIVH